jgi:hypothetical protein
MLSSDCRPSLDNNLRRCSETCRSVPPISTATWWSDLPFAIRRNSRFSRGLKMTKLSSIMCVPARVLLREQESGSQGDRDDANRNDE